MCGIAGWVGTFISSVGLELVEFAGVEREGGIYLEQRVFDRVGQLDELHLHGCNSCLGSREVLRKRWVGLEYLSEPLRVDRIASTFAILKAKDAWFCFEVATVWWRSRARSFRLWPT